MLAQPPVRWALFALSWVLMAAASAAWWFPRRAAQPVELPAAALEKFADIEPEECSPLLTALFDELARNAGVEQVVLLQAIPHDIPQVIAAAEDSSGEEEPTHWSSPWPVVNSLLESGQLQERTTATGRYAGFDYRHTLIPVDATHSRILLINQASPAPTWNLQRTLLSLAAVFLLAVLAATRE